MAVTPAASASESLTIVGGAPEAAAALLLFAAIGVGNALVDIGAYTLPARVAPDAVMARTFATLEALWTLGVAFGAAVTSPVIALLGSRGALLAVGVVGPAAVAMAWPALRALDRRMARRDADIELLHQVALRRPPPPSTIEDLAASPERVVFAAAATVFEEGEAGESFYIVAALHAELLRSDLPRTATVRGADDTILHVGVLARERFIAP